MKAKIRLLSLFTRRWCCTAEDGDICYIQNCRTFYRLSKLVSCGPGLNILRNLVDDVFFTLLPFLQMQTEATGPSVTT